MLLASVAVCVGLLIGLVRKGRFRNLGRARVRMPYLLLVGLGIPLVHEALAEPQTFAVSVASLVALLAFAAVNVHLVGIVVISIGIVMNLVPLVTNGAMPVRAGALVEADLVEAGQSFELQGARELQDGATFAGWLGDTIPLPATRQVLSFGDLVILVGLGDLTTNLLVRRHRRRKSLPRGADALVAALESAPMPLEDAMVTELVGTPVPRRRAAPPIEIDLTEPAPADEPLEPQPAALDLTEPAPADEPLEPQPAALDVTEPAPADEPLEPQPAALDLTEPAPADEPPRAAVPEVEPALADVDLVDDHIHAGTSVFDLDPLADEPRPARVDPVYVPTASASVFDDQGPVDLTDLTEPEPVDPEPIDLTEPEPIDLTDLTEPVDPEPIDLIDLTEPVDPEPIDLTEPVDPVDPEPVDLTEAEPAKTAENATKAVSSSPARSVLDQLLAQLDRGEGFFLPDVGALDDGPWHDELMASRDTTPPSDDGDPIPEIDLAADEIDLDADLFASRPPSSRAPAQLSLDDLFAEDDVPTR